VVDNAESALSFYEKLGFQATFKDENFVIINRNGVDIHLNFFDEVPKQKRSVCWIGVSGIDALYQQCLSNDLVSFPLEDKPYGLREFAVNDPFGNLILFAERIRE